MYGILTALLTAITAACNAYAEWLSWQQETELDRIEDELDRLAVIGNGSSKLRMERLAQRLQRKRTVRSSNGNA